MHHDTEKHAQEGVFVKFFTASNVHYLNFISNKKENEEQIKLA